MLHSIVLAGRHLTIYEPAGLLPGANLLILHDGQNLFEPERSYVYGQTWHVAETVDALIASGDMPPTVIVGIDHGGDRRVREFGHGASTYGRFIIRDVLPYMRSHYDVRRDAAGTAMGGSSMGGLVTLTIATMFPDIFGRILVFSPSVWWHRRAVLRAVRHPGVLGELFGRTRGLSDTLDIWLSIGLEEGQQAIDDARRLRDVIVAMRRGDQSRLRYVEYSDGAHAETSWAKQLPDALTPAASRRRLV